MSISATIDLVGRHEPEASTLGIAIAALSLAVMPVLAAVKRRQALALGSQAAVAEAAQTNVCTMLSAALLVGLVANAALGWWWWADPMAGLTIAGVSAWMAVRTFRADFLEHTCCWNSKALPHDPSVNPRFDGPRNAATGFDPLTSKVWISTLG